MGMTDKRNIDEIISLKLKIKFFESASGRQLNISLIAPNISLN